MVMIIFTIPSYGGLVMDIHIHEALKQLAGKTKIMFRQTLHGSLVMGIHEALKQLASKTFR